MSKPEAEKVIQLKQLKEDRKLLAISKYYQSLSLGHLLKEAQSLVSYIENDLSHNIILKCKEMLKELESRYSNSSQSRDNPIETMRKFLDKKIK